MKTLRRSLAVGVLVAACPAWADGPALVPAPLVEAARSPQCLAGPRVGPSPLRRLTRFEYENTIADLLGDRAEHGRHFPEEGGSGFDNNGDVAVATRIHAHKYLTAAEAIAAQAAKDPVALLGCDPSGDRERACVAGFITDFAARAWRRPLTTQEHESLLAFYQAERNQADVNGAIRLLLTSILQSPWFLYRVESGQSIVNEPGLQRLTDHEVAARLSYFLWGSTPDGTLLAAAARKRLHTPAQIAAQARRLLAHPRARTVVRRFFDQWLGISLLERLQKEKPFAWSPRRLGRLYRTQFDLFIDHVMWKADGRLATLLTSPITFANRALAEYLKMPVIPEGDAFVAIHEGGGQRAGILTLPAFLAMQAKVEETSPIKRGMFVREQLLCQIPPPPPPNMMMMQLPPATAEARSVRERLEDHRLDFGCSKCHKLFDELGLAFENYDTVGIWRELDNGQTVDASGEIVASDVDGSFDNATEMAARLAQSRQVSDCMVRQWFRFAFGRTESEADACTLAELARRFQASGNDIRALIVAITTSDAFLYRNAGDSALASNRAGPDLP